MSTTEELIALAQKGDADAKEQLINENNGLIWAVVRRFAGRGTETDDLYQLGCMGFLKAVDGFDLAFGTQFSTYAVPKISGEIRRFLRDDGMVKVSRGIKEHAVQIKIAASKLSLQLGREPSVTEIAAYTDLSPEQIAIAQCATAGVESIQQQTGEDGFSLENILSDTASEDRLLEHIALRQAIGRLPEKEAMVIGLRFFHGLTQDRVAKVINVSQVQVSRIEKRAIEKLRQMLS